MTVESPDAGASETATFQVTSAATGGNVTTTVTPAGNATGTVPTGAVTGTGGVTPVGTATPAGNATATPTRAPGFGTVVALAGLAGVALLVAHRRD